MQLIPSLEGSTHINLEFTARFIPRYFAEPDAALVDPAALSLRNGAVDENPYLMQASTGAVRTIGFLPYLTPIARWPRSETSACSRDR